ncbi:MAG: invasion protein CiaB [Campylobacteraceae bacterium]|jgi:tetratricopeptide (TPR) repeat protein|nr:invasion protein CiaB [Campylobacteraceae bacterium]
MGKNDFLEDLKKVYELVKKRTARINELYSLLYNNDKKERRLLKKLLKICSLKSTRENKIALLSRLVNLREDMLVITLKQSGKTDQEIESVLLSVYHETAQFHIQEHEKLLHEIEEQKFLTPFYRKLLFGVHEAGKALTSWQPKWTNHIIHTINPKLLKEFGNDARVAKFLSDNDLFDKNADGSSADRSYSALIEDEDGYKNVPYAVVFANEVQKVAKKIENLIDALQHESDDIFNAKEAYIIYFSTLKKAFCEKNIERVISSWQDVDRAWMNIKTPIQVAHPLEYYEDHYKKAVALEWDVRVQNPAKENADTTKKRILCMYEAVFKKADGEQKALSIFEKSMQNINKTDLYISRPMLYYAAQFNGLFSAQVVPNDEIVSKERGKKIFAYADNVLDSIRAKPFMKISDEVFGSKFIKRERELVFKNPNIWHKIYEITTIGHEFGHILWIDDDTENKMNTSGVFKNIEEFKATTGGLCAFFSDMDEELLLHVINDTIKRSVSLIAWQRTAEVEPYYCECLMHLCGLFESGILSFGEKLSIDTNKECVDTLIKWYFDTYTNLAKHYLNKKDAKEFLDRFAMKTDGVYMPRDKTINRFVSYYWELHKAIGCEIDDKDERENWI